MVASTSIMLRSRPPTRYITQEGKVCSGGAGGGAGGDSGGGVVVTDSGGGDSVVKTPTVLQSLEVLELIALTFQ